MMTRNVLAIINWPNIFSTSSALTWFNNQQLKERTAHVNLNAKHLYLSWGRALCGLSARTQGQSWASMVAGPKHPPLARRQLLRSTSRYHGKFCKNTTTGQRMVTGSCTKNRPLGWTPRPTSKMQSVRPHREVRSNTSINLSCNPGLCAESLFHVAIERPVLFQHLIPEKNMASNCMP